MHRHALALALGLGATLAAAPLRAQTAITEEPDAPPPTRVAPGPDARNRELALIHYARGREHYAAGRYRLAVYELETAHSLDPSGTNLLLNLGMVHERLGRIDAALLAYERHLASVTDPAERERTQRVISRLQGARGELADIARVHGRADGIFWVASGAAVASLGIGVAMFATARDGADTTAPTVLTVAGGSLAVLAAVLYFAREAPPRSTLFVGASFAPGAPTLDVAGRF